MAQECLVGAARFDETPSCWPGHPSQVGRTAQVNSWRQEHFDLFLACEPLAVAAVAATAARADFARCAGKWTGPWYGPT